MRRISVVGNSGSGKTTLARRVAAQLHVPYLELDSIFHLPGWQELPDEEFRRQVAEFASQDSWVIDGNYRASQDLVWQRADTVVWIDLPRVAVMRQLVPRTLRHDHYRQRYTAAMTDSALAHLDFLVVRSRREMDELVAALGQSTTA